VEGGDNPGGERNTATSEDSRGEQGEKRGRERSDGGRRDLGPRDALGLAEGRDGEEERIPRRPEIERLGAQRIVSRPRELSGREQVSAGVAELECSEADCARRREPAEKREED
jgi:hypothetical protein